MIDPTKVPFYSLDDAELEEFALFCIAVAGKRAKKTAEILSRFLLNNGWDAISSPFALIKSKFASAADLAVALKKEGMGCYTLKAFAMYTIAYSSINLRTCTVQQLDTIYGIGPKTARFFILHTRPGVRVACLDTHILKYLASKGYAVPKSTPTGKRYEQIEKLFLAIADDAGLAPAVLDISIWGEYASK